MHSFLDMYEFYFSIQVLEIKCGRLQEKDREMVSCLLAEQIGTNCIGS